MAFERTSERLIIAIDYKAEQGEENGVTSKASDYLHSMCDMFAPLGITLKVNTLARILGAHAVEYIHDRDLPCFLDLKLFDIGNTLENDCAWISHYNPAILTVAERVKPAAFANVARALPQTLVLPVDPLTDLTDEDMEHFDYLGRDDAVSKFFLRIWQKQLPGTICAPTDIALAPEGFRRGAVFVTPAVKPAWSLKDDNSANALTPAKAIAEGAAAIVVGRGILAAPDPVDAAKRTLEELEEALQKR